MGKPKSKNKPKEKASSKGILSAPARLLKTMLLTVFFSWVLLTCLVISFKWINPPATTFQLWSQWVGFGEYKTCSSIQQKWVPLEKISRNLKWSVIASEDQLFLEHWGFDFNSIQKAASGNRKQKKIRGASTISQQTAKNLFLWPGKSYVRKGLEVYITLVMELTWSKERILEVYLNVAQFGSCVFGAEAASIYFYQKPASKISLTQGALLASVLPNPNKYKVKKPSRYMKKRSAWIQRQVRQLKGSSHLSIS